jgi:hypothetical protein
MGSALARRRLHSCILQGSLLCGLGERVQQSTIDGGGMK